MLDVLDNLPCLYFSCNTNQVIVSVNAPTCQSLGYAREEIIGQKIDKITTVSTRIFQQTHFFPLLKMHGRAEEIYITLLARDGSAVPVLINARLLEDEGKAISLYTGIIVQQRKKFEEELIAAKKAAEAALHENAALVATRQDLKNHIEQLDMQMTQVRRQNEELSQFNKVVTHDLQEPLRKLAMFSSRLLEEHEAPKREVIISKLSGITGYLHNIISGLQQYVWVTEAPLQPSSVALGELLQEAMAELKDKHDDITIRLQVKDLPRIYGDREQLLVLVYQLLSNAVRFRKPGGEAFMEIMTTDLVRNKLKHSEHYLFSNFIRIQFRDEGQGFDSKYNSQAFQLFKRLHPQSGRGIGLALCKKITENHHGEISILSKSGEGTIVTILLPHDPQQA